MPDETGLMPVTFGLPLDSVVAPVLVISRLQKRDGDKCGGATRLLQTLTQNGSHAPPDTADNADHLWAALALDTSALTGSLPELRLPKRTATIAIVMDRLVCNCPVVANDDVLLVLLARALRAIALHDLAHAVESGLDGRASYLSGLISRGARCDPRSFGGARFALEWLHRVERQAAGKALESFNKLITDKSYDDGAKAFLLWSQMFDATSDWEGLDPVEYDEIAPSRRHPYLVVERLQRREPARMESPSHAFFVMRVYALAGDFRATHLAEKLADLRPRSQALADHLAGILLSVTDWPAVLRLAGRAEALRIAGRRRAAERGTLLVLFEQMLWSFGDTAMRLELIHRLRRENLIDWFPLVIDATPDSNPRGFANQYLIDAWETYFPVIRNKALLQLVQSVADTTQQNQSEYFLMDADRCVDNNQALFEIYHRLDRRPSAATLILPKEDRAWGVAELERRFGVKSEEWFCCFHIRGTGLRGDRSDSAKSAKTADPLTYVRAMKTVVANGGTVFRLGDSTMPALPEMKGVIDIAHSPFKSPRLDVFLCAVSRFLVSTCSGPSAVAAVYGVPQVLTNAMPLDTGGWRPSDLFIHKLLRRQKDGTLVPFARLLKPPFQESRRPLDFTERGYELIDNAEDEIDRAAHEMLALTAGDNPFSESDKARQLLYRKTSISQPRPMGLVGTASAYFLEKYAALLPG